MVTDPLDDGNGAATAPCRAQFMRLHQATGHRLGVEGLHGGDASGQERRDRLQTGQFSRPAHQHVTSILATGGQPYGCQRANDAAFVAA